MIVDLLNTKAKKKVSFILGAASLALLMQVQPLHSMDKAEEKSEDVAALHSAVVSMGDSEIAAELKSEGGKNAFDKVNVKDLVMLEKAIIAATAKESMSEAELKDNLNKQIKIAKIINGLSDVDSVTDAADAIKEMLANDVKADAGDKLPKYLETYLTDVEGELRALAMSGDFDKDLAAYKGETDNDKTKSSKAAKVGFEKLEENSKDEEKLFARLKNTLAKKKGNAEIVERRKTKATQKNERLKKEAQTFGDSLNNIKLSSNILISGSPKMQAAKIDMWMERILDSKPVQGSSYAKDLYPAVNAIRKALSTFEGTGDKGVKREIDNLLGLMDTLVTVFRNSPKELDKQQEATTLLNKGIVSLQKAVSAAEKPPVVKTNPSSSHSPSTGGDNKGGGSGGQTGDTKTPVKTSKFG